MAELYILLFDIILSSPSSVGHGREGFYFGENGEHSLYDVGKEIARVLVELGKGRTDVPTIFSEEEIQKYFGVSVLVPASEFG